MTADSFEGALAQVHAAGFKVQNLFQREAGGWQANLRAEGTKTFSEFGMASTPHGALLAALAGFAPAAASASLFD